MFKDQLMINRNNLSGEISFGCIMCDESDDICCDCRKESSSYDMGYRAGNNGLESNAIHYDGNLEAIYEEGYVCGRNARAKHGESK